MYKNKKLVILESPTKTKAVQSYLGKNYKVVSSEGHITNLSTSKGILRLGFNLEDMTTYYKIAKGKKPLITKLKTLSEKYPEVIIATDPDREGEAIAMHLKNYLNLENKYSRVTFNEINEKAIQEAFSNPHKINDLLFKAQESRRILDRIIGFRLSKLLQKKIKSRSAGRVQSVALKIISEREAERSLFDKNEYWSIEAKYKKNVIVLYSKKNISDEKAAREIAKKITPNFKVNNKIQKKMTSKPPKPFTTSTLLQKASNVLNFSAANTMFLAQQLYEGIKINDKIQGLVNYPRTDSQRIANHFQEEIKKHIKREYGENYINPRPFVYKKRKNDQNAHEAFRVTNLKITPQKASNFLKPKQLKLYTLVYNQTLACFMADSISLNTNYTLENNDTIWKFSNSETIFDGFQILFKQPNKDKILELDINDIIKIKKISLIQHFTKPKPRYSEASLIKVLEELGIGRPSTYSNIIQVLIKRNYVIKDKKTLKPTERGLFTNKVLQEWFNNLINENYTSKIESDLDIIAQGGKDNKELITHFWYLFDEQIREAEIKLEEVPPKWVGEPCPRCSEPLIYREGRYGEFIGCSGFPKCRYIKSLSIVLGKCPKCNDGDIIIRKNSRNKEFLSCSLYNETKCDFIDKYIPPKKISKKEDKKNKVIEINL